MNKELILSETQKKIVELKPEGSVVSKKEIKDLYFKFSKSQRRKKISSGCKTTGAFRSVRASRRLRGGDFYNRMIKLGFWNEKKI